MRIGGGMGLVVEFLDGSEGDEGENRPTAHNDLETT